LPTLLVSRLGSIREPQVFTLESIFQSFDEIAKKYGVFKVETVGDCYVCVMGVPVQQTTRL
jgi:class 3 adenylate cyclase